MSARSYVPLAALNAVVTRQPHHSHEDEREQWELKFRILESGERRAALGAFRLIEIDIELDE
jgi:hypothetical protein